MATVTDREGFVIEVGTRVLFDTGYPPEVPMGLVGTLGTVRAITRRGKLVIGADDDAYGERRVWPARVSVRKATLLMEHRNR